MGLQVGLAADLHTMPHQGLGWLRPCPPPGRPCHPSAPPQEDFQAAADLAGKIAAASGITNDEKLEMYSLFKQASDGDCSTGEAPRGMTGRDLCTPRLPVASRGRAGS